MRYFPQSLAALWIVICLWVLVARGPEDDPPPPAAPLATYAYMPAPALSYEERFSPTCLGPPATESSTLGDWAWADAVMGGHCPGPAVPSAHCAVSRAAVTAQGVGE